MATPQAACPALDLAVVMPVYNEQECISQVVRSWMAMLEGLKIRFTMIVLNDGSRDGTAAVLAGLLPDDRLEIVSKPNTGHGPTVLLGYRKAVEAAEWVFQCDSDDEMSPEHFPSLWGLRGDYDALFGVRAGRRQNLARGLISAVSRSTVRLLFGRGVRDVNTPYRLIRSDVLGRIVRQVPDDTLAPNVIISGAIARARLRIRNQPVPHRGRRTGKVSIMKWRLWKFAVRAFFQTLRRRPTLCLALAALAGAGL